MRLKTSHLPGDKIHGAQGGWPGAEEGFTLVEALIAVFVLAFGLLAAGQMIFVAASSSALARCKGNAALLAQGKLEFLADMYNRDPGLMELDDGEHGPEQVDVPNPSGHSILNRYDVSWTVSEVPDPRAGVELKAKRVTVSVTPIDAAGKKNLRASFNKVVTVSTILSAKTT
jgi:type II secretory pathway pseudopilin PulG